MVKLTVFFIFLAIASLDALAFPIFEPRRGSTSKLNTTEVAAYEPYTYFASIAGCEPSLTRDWTCGAKCEKLSNFVPVASGGDGGRVQWWYVGYDKSLAEIIVGYEGTDPKRIESIQTDLDVIRDNPDPTLFPGLSSKVKTHNGFGEAHARYLIFGGSNTSVVSIWSRSANEVLDAVVTAMQESGFTNVTTVGHSLGAALALISAVHLKHWLNESTVIRSIGYGMPRVGNQAFVDYVNSKFKGLNVRINNKEDPIPIVPGRRFGFAHTDTEIHIGHDNQWTKCEGQDNTSSECTIGYVPDFHTNISYHNGPYGNVFMRCAE
ncbi:hypothetical protein AMATHDRAFT_3474 [Amanita thiersii Skay4041]|uniref:Fungal lipase-type domain-containing protein n=1 Tax=Amanita thiersii Skay4041 TaxID=703135 RepID=A0A2A9NTE9_9AGAR|nr:hypothetical protein AMATHDRAFT_3474 [Amanita thiersii Skay4041]